MLDVAIDEDQGEMLLVEDFDVTQGTGGSWAVLHILVTADNGAGTEGSPGHNSETPDDERYAISHCSR